MRNGIVLIGPYCSGKTSCSKMIASMCGWKRYDLDEIYTERFGENIWVTRNRDKKASDLNRDEIGREIMSAMKETVESIVVLGGGSFFQEHPESIKTAKKSHVFIYLQPSIRTLAERSLNGNDLDLNNTVLKDTTLLERERYFEKVMLQRGSYFNSWADRIVQPEQDQSSKEVCFEILSKYLAQRNND